MKQILIGLLITVTGAGAGIFVTNNALGFLAGSANDSGFRVPASVMELQSSVADTASKVMPSIVHITTYKRVVNPFDPRVNPRDIASGIGSGVIISEDGYVVTNKHVVMTGQDVKVMLSDGREGMGRLVGVDNDYTDIAVLKLEGIGGLTPLKFVDSDSVRIGDFVLAIGSPFGYHHSVTFGIVSAKGRWLASNEVEDYIQTDAPLNPGNSGGALVNLKGELIGMNTAIVTKGGAMMSSGVGLAYTSNIVKRVTEDLIRYGRYKRGYLGVAMRDIDARLAAEVGTTLPTLLKEEGLDRKEGAIVMSVEPGTPAEEAQLKVGDIILEVDGKKVMNHNDVRIYISIRRPGETARLTLLRNKRKLTVDVKIAEFPTR